MKPTHDKGAVEYGAHTVTSDQHGDVFQPYIAISGLGANDDTIVFHGDALFKTAEGARAAIIMVSRILSGELGFIDKEISPHGTPSDLVK